jgi:type IV pilus biogenesis protein CpaD/CtpE
MTRMRAISVISPISIAAAAALLAGCTANDTTLGDALKTNVALQVVDPDPVARTDAVPGGSGERSAVATARYRTGNVKQPVSIQTTSKTSGGAAGSN